MGGNVIQIFVRVLFSEHPHVKTCVDVRVRPSLARNILMNYGILTTNMILMPDSKTMENN